MNLAKPFLQAAALALMTSIVAACGDPGATPLTASRYDRTESSISPRAATTKRLAYISDLDTGVVHVYDYDSGRALGKLTGFQNPQGQCVDKNGAVFITDFAKLEVVEYAHGGNKRLQTLSTGGSAVDCSVAPNGNLAVANSHTVSGAGDVAIFRNASGQPVAYSNSSCDSPVALGYDIHGNLYIQTGYSSTVCEIARGSDSMKVVQSNADIVSPIGVMWDGKHITLADDYYSGSVTETVIYQMKESASGDLTQVGKTTLTDRACYGRDVSYYPFILGAKNTPVNKSLAKDVVAPNSFCVGALYTWKYTTGGDPESSFKSTSGDSGHSISIAP